MRDITIQPVMNGFVVRIGCQTVVFASVEIMTTEVRRYYEDPVGTEARYQEKKGPQMGPRPSQVEPVEAPRDLPMNTATERLNRRDNNVS